MIQTRQTLDCDVIKSLCNSIKRDVDGGCTDGQTLSHAMALVRHIASWQRGYQCEVVVTHIDDTRAA